MPTSVAQRRGRVLEKIPSVFSDAPAWLTFGVASAFVVCALLFGILWTTTRTVRSLRWATEDRTPTRYDQRNTFLAPGGSRRRTSCCGYDEPPRLALPV